MVDDSLAGCDAPPPFRPQRPQKSGCVTLRHYFRDADFRDFTIQFLNPNDLSLLILELGTAEFRVVSQFESRDWEADL
jgi:hypothetical protein